MDLLPGGYWDGSNCLRNYSFRELTGQLEIDLVDAVAESGGKSGSVPAVVTYVLLAALDNIDGAKPNREIVHNLSVVDRQYLMRKLAVILGYDSSWFSKQCSNCTEKFDFQITYSDLPVIPAKDGYPFVTVATRFGEQIFRVPTGADQESVLNIRSDADAERILLKRCHFAGAGFEKTDFENIAFQKNDIEKIGAALEQVSPGIITNINAGCPGCGEQHLIRLDPYFLLQKNIGEDLFNDIHVMAKHYHWNEREILALSRKRRQIYLDLIEQDSIGRE